MASLQGQHATGVREAGSERRVQGEGRVEPGGAQRRCWPCVLLEAVSRSVEERKRVSTRFDVSSLRHKGTYRALRLDMGSPR
jgi:hypothetical protein